MLPFQKAWMVDVSRGTNEAVGDLGGIPLHLHDVGCA